MAEQTQKRIAPPIPFLTAVWAGMSHHDILAGLRAGDIVRPARLPDWAGQLEGARTGDPTRTAASPIAVDRARVSAWFCALDPDLSTAAFEAMWRRAGADDAARGSNLTSFLGRTLLQDSREADSVASARREASVATRLDAFLENGAHHARVVELAGKTGQQLSALAKTDSGYRYALTNLDPVALTGNGALFSDGDADGSLSGFDSNSSDHGVTDAWLADRGKLLAWKLRDTSGQPMEVAGNEDWTFVDRGSKGADGKPLAFEIKTGSADAGQNQVVFGTNDDEVFKGISGSDRIYAGGGDDVLRGAAGGDHLEGGDGDDLAMGGAGNDELLGGRGNDELEGGRGDDHLEGGVGDDTYVIDSGDGSDTIVDEDGIGTIELDGEALRGTMQGGGGKWTDARSNAEFAFDGDLASGGTLTISTFDQGADPGHAPRNTVTVKDWKNGDLGITLGGDTGANPVAPDDDPQVPGTSSTHPDCEAWHDQGTSAPDDSGTVTSDPASSDASQPAAGEATAEAPSHAGEGALEDQFDFDAALDSLLGGGDQTFNAVDPTSYRQAIEAFSGVLEPPDVPAVANNGDTAELGTVTEAAMADALAGDYSSDAFDNFEPAHAHPIASVDVASLMEMKRAGVEVRRSATV